MEWSVYLRFEASGLIPDTRLVLSVSVHTVFNDRPQT